MRPAWRLKWRLKPGLTRLGRRFHRKIEARLLEVDDYLHVSSFASRDGVQAPRPALESREPGNVPPSIGPGRRRTGRRGYTENLYALSVA